jgi:hypothetical protein
VVNAEVAFCADREEVPRLAVTVIHDRVKECDRTERCICGVYRRNRNLHAKVINPELNGTLASWPIAQNGWRDNAQAERFAHLKSGNLAPSKRPFGEVPERSLAANRLVDHLQRRRNAFEFAEEGGVTRIGESADRVKPAGTAHCSERIARADRAAWDRQERRRV